MRIDDPSKLHWSPFLASVFLFFFPLLSPSSSPSSSISSTTSSASPSIFHFHLADNFKTLKCECPVSALSSTPIWRILVCYARCYDCNATTPKGREREKERERESQGKWRARIHSGNCNAFTPAASVKDARRVTIWIAHVTYSGSSRTDNHYHGKYVQ